MEEAQLLRDGAVGIIPTDTLYGIVAPTSSEEAVKRVYALKRRTPTKPNIILISSMSELAQFGIALSDQRKKILEKYWPGPVSIILPCGSGAPEYLHRGTGTLAFRLPLDEWLRDFLAESGPLIAPSANVEGAPPATTVEEARKYFGDSVDFYLERGERVGNASTIISLDENNSVTVVRAGTQALPVL